MKPDENATLANSFMRSCNTAFIKLIDEKPLTDDSLTTGGREALRSGPGQLEDRHRLVRRQRPRLGGPDRAANAIGQGQVQMSPLNMASVTATAITGAFRQPYLVVAEARRPPTGHRPGSAVEHRRPSSSR